jgi:hypothetical protein
MPVVADVEPVPVVPPEAPAELPAPAEPPADPPPEPPPPPPWANASELLKARTEANAAVVSFIMPFLG